MPLHDLSLLFVEDDPFTQEQFRIFFREGVREFYQAYNGEEGWRLYRQLHPDIIITDLQMPGMDGLEMIRRIREFDSQQMILILSAHNDREILLRSIELQIDGFIPKPILDIDEILVRLETIARKLEAQRAVCEESNERRIRELYNKAYFDTLTGIYNRHYFDERFKSMLYETTQRNLALLFIDLDDLKQINDRYGHSVGDRALIRIADDLKRLAPTPGFLARIGGDEFAMLLPECDEETLREIVGMIQKKRCISVENGGPDIELSLSVGCSLYPRDAHSGEALLRQADQAMYQAKRSGKGCSFLYRQKEDGHESSLYRFPDKKG